MECCNPLIASSWRCSGRTRVQVSVEPLLPDIWFERIEVIARRELGGTENCLRHAFHLLQLTPREFHLPDYGKLNEAVYEALLESGDFDAAARKLVVASTLSVSTTSVGGRVRAVIRCSAIDKTITGDGKSVADAILQAWTACLLMLRMDGPTWLRANDL